LKKKKKKKACPFPTCIRKSLIKGHTIQASPYNPFRTP